MYADESLFKSYEDTANILFHDDMTIVFLLSLSAVPEKIPALE